MRIFGKSIKKSGGVPQKSMKNSENDSKNRGG
jgi:hypothetical protein